MLIVDKIENTILIIIQILLLKKVLNIAELGEVKK